MSPLQEKSQRNDECCKSNGRSPSVRQAKADFVYAEIRYGNGCDKCGRECRNKEIVSFLLVYKIYGGKP